MIRMLPSSLRLVLLALVTLLPMKPALAADAYNVSYLWSRYLHSAEDYRAKVAAVLGPQIAGDLRIVEKESLYGVIYYRRGSAYDARRVAASHTRLLQARGLDRAVPMRARNWNFADRAPVEAKRVAKAASPTSDARAIKASFSPATESATETVREAVAKRSMHNDIEEAVEGYVKKLRARGVINSHERTAWSVYDFTSGEKLVGINEDAKFQAASLVKPFFAMAFFHKVQEGKLHYGPKSRRHMERMIQRSNNYSTNWIMRQVGGPAAVQSILSDQYPGIFENTEIVEYIPAGGRTYRNKASVHDYSRFLYALWKEDIPGADEIKRLMALPGKDRIYTGAHSIPKGTAVYNKTGSTAQLCGDMGILVVRDRKGKRYPYIIIGVIERDARARNYSSWIRSRGNVIRGVSNIVYDGISRHHGLRS